MIHRRFDTFLFSQVESRSCLLLVYIHFEKCLKCFLGRNIIYKIERNKRENKKTKRANYVYSFDLNFLNQLYRYISSKINNSNGRQN